MVVVSATAVESQDTLHVTVPVVEALVAVDTVAVEAVVADQVSTRHCLIQFFNATATTVGFCSTIKFLIIDRS